MQYFVCCSNHKTSAAKSQTFGFIIPDFWVTVEAYYRKYLMDQHLERYLHLSSEQDGSNHLRNVNETFPQTWSLVLPLLSLSTCFHKHCVYWLLTKVSLSKSEHRFYLSLRRSSKHLALPWYCWTRKPSVNLCIVSSFPEEQNSFSFLIAPFCNCTLESSGLNLNVWHGLKKLLTKAISWKTDLVQISYIPGFCCWKKKKASKVCRCAEI